MNQADIVIAVACRIFLHQIAKVDSNVDTAKSFQMFE